MADRVNPHWLKLGSQIRLLREAQGLSQAQLSQALNISQAMLSAVERGIRNCKPHFLHKLTTSLTQAGRSEAWEINHTNSAFPHWFRDIVQLQRAASEIWEFQIALIPGLLQTKEYARNSRIQLAQPTASVEEIDQKAQTRLDRQSILTSARPPLLVVVRRISTDPP